MKRIIKTMKRLGAQAEHWRDVVEAAPQKAAQLQQALQQTAGQLQQLRNDVQSGFKDLKADDDGSLLARLAEIRAGADVLHEAGFEITGVDIELGLVRRAIVHLEQHEEIPLPVISSLRARQHQNKAVPAILGGLIQARELADRVVLEGLPRFVVTVQLGTAPGIRVGWRPELGFDDEEHVVTPSTAPQAMPQSTMGTPPPLPDPMAGGYFDRRAAPAAATPPVPTSPVAEPTIAAPQEAAASHQIKLTPRITNPEPEPGHRSADWRVNALDRFKKMPKL